MTGIANHDIPATRGHGRRGLTLRCSFGTLCAATALALSVGSAAASKPPLREVSVIDDGLFYVAVANEIRKGCDTISARPIKALSVLQSLRSQAFDLGYSQAEIDAYTESEAEKDRMRARGARLYASRGVDPTKPADLCRLGREEIAMHTQIGVLLKED
jgi:hypothetical protein